jgi:hypothetical protein
MQRGAFKNTQEPFQKNNRVVGIIGIPFFERLGVLQMQE